MKIKLNLISDKKRDEIEKNLSFKFALRQGMELLVIIIFIATSLLSFQWIQKIELDSAENDILYNNKKKEFDRIKEYDDRFSQINDLLGYYEKMQKSQIHWIYFFERLTPIVPAGVTFSEMTNKNFQIILSGNASERDVLLELKNNLEKEECFEEVNLPLSNLVSKSDISFQMEFNLKKDCFQNK